MDIEGGGGGLARFGAVGYEEGGAGAPADDCWRGFDPG